MNEIDYTSAPVEDIYGSSSFNDKAMREWLPTSIYKEVKAVQAGEKKLTLEVAEVVASAMKDWAAQKGATHYTHWFLPLTGSTAEKHDSFICPQEDGTVIMEFSGKELIQSESDASSFPSGGLRATFEARGYTAWDSTSPAFLKEEGGTVTLCIPTAFVSYNGQALDKKVLMLRSVQALNKQAMRVLRVLGNTSSKRVNVTVGPEQEYFLIDKLYFDQRPDLQLTGRTLFGAPAPKGQEMSHHYYGAITERVAAFMRELNFELWKLGISAKTQHNEVAPHQYEVAPVYAPASLALDSNHLIMETLRKVGERHGLAALLHEKPFTGLNGSGKHNNWSLGTDDGINLLEPGNSPESNAQFLLFLAATIKAVDSYAGILRASASNAGNDQRLGGHEAPPAIISIFLGDQLTEIVEAVAAGRQVSGRCGGHMEIGVDTLPRLPKDLTDRNRTSPFAFTGNKFEFRMVASSQSIAGPNVVLNTAVADVLKQFADRLEETARKDPAKMKQAIQDICRETFSECSRVIFNGNGYSEEWKAEALRRELPHIPFTVYALCEYLKPENMALFKRHNVASLEEMESRVAVYLESYAMQINIEAAVMCDMASRIILPAAAEYASFLAEGIKNIQNTRLITGVPQAQTLRLWGDRIETLIGRDFWPLPSYEDMLFRM
ncbi:MAG: glutamine synthetase type III [Spirochaetales bacterium]|nr:MAG: glutamine synthetase type III [Spirochaetales bacterium]